MDWYRLEPYVAGGIGDRSEFDRTASPPRVSKLHYEFDDWAGDAIVESTPCFLITEIAGKAILEAQFTGFDLKDVEVTTSFVYAQLHDIVDLPAFRWLDVTGTLKADDFALTKHNSLVVSDRALDILRPNLPNCEIKKVKGSKLK